MARDPAIRTLLEQAGREETDHLAWCEQRLRELQDRPSLLDPVWYIGSFAIGVAAGPPPTRPAWASSPRPSGRWSATWIPISQQLPAGDSRSRAILAQMRSDEQAHGELARGAGGVTLPRARAAKPCN